MCTMSTDKPIGKTLVRPRVGGIRPYLTLEPTDHPLSVDFANGISINRAQEIAEHVMHQG